MSRVRIGRTRAFHPLSMPFTIPPPRPLVPRKSSAATAGSSTMDRSHVSWRSVRTSSVCRVCSTASAPG
eukprot:scaffold95801_cov64-Phaeocystis_antarctica.AAC.4